MYAGDDHSVLDVRFNTALINAGHAITFWHVNDAKVLKALNFQLPVINFTVSGGNGCYMAVVIGPDSTYIRDSFGHFFFLQSLILV